MALSKQLIYAISKIGREIYKDIKEQMPVVHHIVPHGAFSNRGEFVRKKLLDAQEMMKAAGIDVKNDPFNLVIISTGYHSKIHTDGYLLFVSAVVLSTDGSREQIYLMLVLLRASIVAGDSYNIP